ncbi:MAG: peptidyl-prolyl cis-trans isomerase, partial [Thermoanaerobaculia bacterium]|nr:peptidyl-prolyl cis-trans isomerase [Thermoanaerobaculia bacterium]
IWDAESYPPEVVREKVEKVLEQDLQKRRWEEMKSELLASQPIVMEPETALEDSSPDEAIVLRFDGEELSRRELELRLQAGAVPRRLDQLSAPVLTQLMQASVLQSRGARRARDLGLHLDEDLHEWRRRQILASAEMVKRVNERVEVPTREDVIEYFESHRDDFRRPPGYDLSLLRIPLVAGNERETYARGLEAEDQIRTARMSFEEAVSVFAPSQTSKPRIGWVERSRVATLGRGVLAEVDRLQPGELSRLVQEESFLYLIQLHDRQAERPMSMPEAESAVTRKLGNLRVGELQDEISRQLRDELEVRLASQSPLS